VSTAAQVGADLIDLAKQSRKRVAVTVTRYGVLLQTAVRSHAREPRTAFRPGQPGEGPRLLTGGYLRTINRRTHHTASTSTSEVGSNDDRARRLEMGFTGTDSLGREFDQQAYEHFGPGLDDVDAPFQAALAAAIRPGRAK